jgi:hypothetical protein
LLINEGANRLKNRGAKSILIAVEQHNPNRAFYEHLVANQFGEKPLDWDGYQTKLILYRWENLDELCRLTSA